MGCAMPQPLDVHAAPSLQLWGCSRQGWVPPALAPTGRYRGKVWGSDRAGTTLPHFVPGTQADVASAFICVNSYVNAGPRGEEVS